MRGSAALRAAVTPGGGLAGAWVRDELWRRARAVPSLDLRFADSKSLVDATTGQNLVTFSRASGATFVDSQGVIRNAVTNLLLRSEEFGTTWTTLNASISADQITAPNGTLTSDKLIETASTGAHYVTQAVSALTGVYTVSVFIKAAEISHAMILMVGGTTQRGVGFNLTTGATYAEAIGGVSPPDVGASAVSVGDGWWRCRMTWTADGQTTLRIYTDSGAGTGSTTGTGTSGLYVWGAQLEQSSTVGEYVPTGATINSAPRFDHNPTTGESLGLLVEEARTNSIRNNTMVGAVAGTPGTLPTNWSTTVVTTTGLSTSVVAVNSESGINYIDLRLSGTASGAGTWVVAFEGNGVITASNGQTWSGSVYWKIADGSLNGLSGGALRYDERSTIFLGTQTLASGSPSVGSLIGQRLTGAATNSNAATTNIAPYLRFTIANGAAIDITLRIGMPQLEQGAFATSVIPTTGTAATRAADVASISGSNFSSWYNSSQGSLYAEPVFTTAVSFNTVYCLGDGTSSNRTRTLQWNNGTNRPLAVESGGVSQVGMVGTGGVGAFKFAVGLQQDNFAVSQNGATPLTDTSGLLSVSDRIFLGNTDGSVFYLNGTLKRYTYWPQRLPNSTLQSIAQ